MEIPEEVKQAGLKLNMALKRKRKACRQFDLWRKELELSDQEVKVIQEESYEVQSRWRDDGTMEPREELTK